MTINESEAPYGYSMYASGNKETWEHSGWALDLPEAITRLASYGGGTYTYGTIIPTHLITERLLNTDGSPRNLK